MFHVLGGPIREAQVPCDARVRLLGLWSQASQSSGVTTSVVCSPSMPLRSSLLRPMLSML